MEDGLNGSESIDTIIKRIFSTFIDKQGEVQNAILDAYDYDIWTEGGDYDLF